MLILELNGKNFVKYCFLELAVQQTAMDVFQLLVGEFGMDWTQIHIVRYLIKLSYSRNTYNKITLLSFAKICATIMCIKFRSININMRERAVK